MDLAQLYKKHDQDKQAYNELRDKIWSDIKQKHEQIILAFGSKDNLPQSFSKQIDKELNDFTKDWAIPHGVRYKAMSVQHQQQFEAIAGKSPALDGDDFQKSGFEKSLASTKAKQKSKQREKSPEKFVDFDKNKESMNLDLEY